MNSCPKCGCTMILDSSSGQYSCGCNFVVKEQPQKPRSIWAIIGELPEKVSDEDITATYRQWCVRASDYIIHLESENKALKERVAELEKQQACIVEWCKLSIEHMKPYAGDQSEYDGMYQAASDLLDRINGTMPWPDLVMERLSKVK